MCQFPSCCVTRDKKLLWDKDIHSHSGICEIHKIIDDQAKYEYNLHNFTLIQDSIGSWPPFAKKSHDNIALRHFEKHYGSPEKLIKAVKKLNPEKFTQWSTLYRLIKNKAGDNLPKCPRPYPCPYRRPYPYPCPYPCPSLSKRQERDWARAWKKKWIELYSDPENRY